MGNIVVIGSVNMDMVCSVDKRPEKGETILGNSFFTSPGGKGANQAVSASKLGANVKMISCVGEDSLGEELIRNFKENKVDYNLIARNNQKSSGVAVITLCENDNSIVVVPGTNELVDINLIKKNEEEIKNADIVLLQLEIPLETIKYVVNFCFENNIKVLLNPAPAIRLDEDIIEKVTYLTPNEHEYKIVFDTEESIEEVLKKHPNKLVVTEGKNGARFYDGKEVKHVSCINVDVQDTTGAGDTFNGALSVAITEGKDLYTAVGYAVVVSGLSVTKLGAQSGMPYREDVEKYLDINK
ncbi:MULTISPECIES: ribokinase [unclassified Clostridioides]|uniref:ribokinase n=1 Tax=unclassified Clostridioides TaxID=2635829 RepID=UPI001D0CA82D|nr:ribokinase [Clostridioides sp. ES-S-0001-02]MCC0641052.1 ribokinase [Clostridioides sp. ES-S-0049-03]MCC0654091.1 ribokinase [Clostridioides sp. ES-S-0001-03]MCC0658014.1 ribokinase [Clostridioides sp. ES-S-0123-01]MCC0674282.1 ribokinase [Clostridioides sp. ES-S-0145-01]MCC0677271.1 ribokinase [Clostridioides sp. ES-W-0018-02]MCC0681609.1 ribokinase [Clostridioides sp. ES-S-0005-03]MCC0703853.1 ribokinase [Clostridioides sp. ES-S-0049-02]MCC0712136.1 ribokinase [Clostridioides sp. ES-W-